MSLFQLQGRENESLKRHAQSVIINPDAEDGRIPFVDAVCQFLDRKGFKLPAIRSPFDCLICTNLLDQPVILSCGHSFCLPCIVVRQNLRECPYCKHAIIPTASPPPLAIALVEIIKRFLPGELNVIQLLKQADDAFISAQFEDALQLYNKVLDESPSNHLAAGNLALIQLQQGNIETAFELALRSVQLMPTHSKNIYTLGRILAIQGEYKMALQALALSLKWQPRDSRILRELMGVIVKFKDEEDWPEYLTSKVSKSI
jgi:tetratricopeptide (TPR) repeat protein